jgi:hypothetical protein
MSLLEALSFLCELFQSFLGVGKLIDLTDFDHWRRVDFDYFLRTGCQLDAQSSCQRSPYRKHERVFALHDFSPIKWPVGLVKKQHVGSQGKTALRTLRHSLAHINFFPKSTVVVDMIIVTSDLLGIAMYSIVLIFLLAGLQMQIVDILSHQGDFQSLRVQDLSQLVDQEVEAVGLERHRHLVDLLEALPISLGLFVVEHLCNEFFRLILLAFP